MTRPLRTVLAGALAVVFAAAGYLFYQWRAGAFGEGSPDAMASGQMVLTATVADLDGALQPLAQWRGKVLVVNFWATWCAPCREEIPGFITLQDRYRARGVQFVGIAVDRSEDVGPYAGDIGINYPLLVGGLETLDFARRLGNRMGVLPFTLVIDRGGKAVTSSVGVLKPEKLENLLLSLL